MAREHPVRRYKDLKDRLRVLRAHLALVDGDPAFLKSIREDLRTLTKNGDKTGYVGLILEVADLFGKTPRITFSGGAGIPESNPRSRDRTIDFKDYLEEEMVPGDGVARTIKEFIWIYASQKGAHSDPNPKDFVRGSGLTINGFDPKDLEITSIARNVLMVGTGLVDAIDTSICPCGSGKIFPECHGM